MPLISRSEYVGRSRQTPKSWLNMPAFSQDFSDRAWSFKFNKRGFIKLFHDFIVHQAGIHSSTAKPLYIHSSLVSSPFQYFHLLFKTIQGKTKNS